MPLHDRTVPHAGGNYKRVKLATRESLLLKVFVLPPAGKPNSRNPWAWIPTLYLAEGIPYSLITVVSLVLYKDLQVRNRDAAFYTSLMGLPWVLKPLWSPVMDILRTRRWWIWAMQLMIGAGLAMVALSLTLPGGNFFFWTVVLFMVMAVASASHDVAADGFYLLANSEAEQSFFSGVRNSFYRVAMICCQGPLLVLAGVIYKHNGDIARAWQIAFALTAAGMIALAWYHWFILPRPAQDVPGAAGAKFFHEFNRTFEVFLQKPGIGRMILFLLCYRLGEAQLLKMEMPFLKDLPVHGGLGLATEQVGWVNWFGVTSLLMGGILGGVLVSRQGLRAWLWPMVIIMHAPDLVYVYLSNVLPHELPVVISGICLEQFGYGFGFAAYMLYMIYIARGKHQTAHYAICTGIMALGVMLPGMWSGWLQERLGYPSFFVWVLISTIPGFIATALIPLEAEFGKRATVSPS